MTDWKWAEGSWPDLNLKDLGELPLTDIGVPWAYSVHIHPNYDRLFWDVWENGLKTPLLVRPWDWPPLGNRGVWGCNERGNRIDNMPAPIYPKEPEYELVIGNMRFCASYITGRSTVPCLLLPEEEWLDDVQDLWAKYHPVFEGTWYDHPDYKFEKHQKGTAIIKSGK